MIVTIDGYAGTGKSTAANRLADALGFHLLNTGAMYRAIGVWLIRQGFDPFAEPPDLARLPGLLESVHFDMPPGHVWLNGEDFTKAIQSEQAGAAASKVGTFAAVRTQLQHEQRRLADQRDIVCEGRDQGTAVFPQAEVKFFLRASADVRADRRVEQLRSQHLPADHATIRKMIVARDLQDETRTIDPLRPAPDAHLIDTTDLTQDDVLIHMLEIVRQWPSRA